MSKKFLEYEKSIRLLKEHINEYDRVEKIALTQCLDRILAEDLRAKQDYPNTATAAMDGFAIRSHEQDKPLKILGVTNAGKMPTFVPKAYECVKTFTGALMSEDCDSLVPVENVRVQDDTLFIEKPVPKGFAVRQKGESYQKDELILKKGTKLGVAELGLLAELGYFHISVFIEPVVGILSSGDELKDLGECLENEAQIRSSNHLALANLAKKFGARAIVFPLLKDDEKSVEKEFQRALQSCDILVSTGGVSMGDFDFIKKNLQHYELIIDKVAIKPGRHIKIARSGEKFIFALPGFAYSSMVTFRLFVGFLLNSYLRQENESFEAIFEGNYKRKSEFFEFVACNVYTKGGQIFANLQDKRQGSSAINVNLLQKSALLCVPIGTDELQNGALVQIVPLY